MTEPARSRTADDRPLYETDFHRWALEQAEALRQASEGAGLGIDWENVAEEIESLARQQITNVHDHLWQAIEPLLKLEYSAVEHRRHDWRYDATVHRVEARSELADSPSLYAKIDRDRAYGAALRIVAHRAADDRLPADILPRACPYTLDQLLDLDWWPVNRHGLD